MIAIALACEPKLIIADEPTTALDVTIQAQILELMQQLTRRLGVALIVITHNLGVVARYAHRVNVMYAGRIVESGTVGGRSTTTPQHPYTMALLKSVPRLDRPRQARLDPIEGQPPDLTRLDQGCSFRPRCRFAVERCAARAAAARAGRRRAGSSPPAGAARARRRSRQGGMSDPAATARAPLLEVRGLQDAFPDHRGDHRPPQDRRGQGGRRRRPDDRDAARRSASSAKAAAARRRWAAASCGSKSRPTARSSTTASTSPGSTAARWWRCGGASR